MMDSTEAERTGIEAVLPGRSSIIAGRINALSSHGLAGLPPRQTGGG
jgi:hypothetical protein